MKKRLLRALALLAVALLLFWLVPKGPFWLVPKGPFWLQQVFSWIWIAIVICASAWIIGLWPYIKKLWVWIKNLFR